MAVMLCAMGVGATVSAQGRPASAAQAIREFPAWKVLPTQEFATLTDRMVGKMRIALYVYGNGRKRHVCVQEVAVQPAGRFDLSVSVGQPECGRLAGGKGFVATAGGFEKEDVTVVGVVSADTELRRVSVRVAPGHEAGRRSRMLSAAQAAKADVERLRFSTIIVPHYGCLQELAGYDGANQRLFGSSRECSP